MKKKILLTLVIVAVFTFVFALAVSAVDIDGIDYSFKGAEATVTSVNKGCKLTVVNIPETVTYGETTYTVAYIADSAFRDNGVVTEITTPSTIKDIYEHAFRSMSALEKITLNASKDFTHFRNAEFWSCGSLTYVDLRGCVGLTGLGDGGTYDNTFEYCTALETVLCPNTITYIGGSTFFTCSSLTDIGDLDFSKVTYVGSKAFWHTHISGDVILSENATYVGSHAFRGTNITSLVIRASSEATQTTYDDATFYGCTQLKYVVIPDNIQILNQYTFTNCSSLEYIILGSGYKQSKSSTNFSGCGSLKAIIYDGTAEQFAALSGASHFGTVAYDDFSNYVHGTLPSTRTVYCNASGKTCSSCNGILRNEESFVFEYFVSNMGKGKTCYHCAKAIITTTYDPMIECLGLTAPEEDLAAASIRYRINKESIAIYENETGNIVEYGMYATIKDVLAGNDILDAEGNANGGAIKISVPTDYVNLEIKLLGIGDDQKDTLFALGAFVKLTNKDTSVEYVLVEYDKPKANDKYYFTSYNEIIGA